METLLRFIPIKLCYQIGQLVGIIGYHTIAKRRNSVIRNLNIAFGDKILPKDIPELAKKVFSTNGGNLVSSAKTATMSKENIAKCVEIEGTDLIDQFTKDNNGAITVLAHMGNWEIAARLNEIYYPDTPVAAMYRPLNNPYMDRLVKRRREKSNTRLFSKKDSIKDILEMVRQNGLLGILSDQRAGTVGIVTPFFGRLTSFVPLPDIYKRRTKCGAMSLSIFTVSPGKWKVIYKEEATNTTQINTADIADMVERIILHSPTDNFWLQDRWKLSEQPLELLGKTPIQFGKQSKNLIRQTPFAIYIDKITEANVSALEQLAACRPDLKATIFTTDLASASENLKSNAVIITSPPISRQSEFSEFAEAHFTNIFHDLFLLPEGSATTECSELNLTLPYQLNQYSYNPMKLLASLKKLGMPSEPVV